jgi:hypothetical protein
MPTNSTIAFDIVNGSLHSACQKLINADKKLFYAGVNEQTLTQNLSRYLEDSFPGYNVDCEYNRHIKGHKKLRNGRKRVRPDVIVHKRLADESNLLVVEAKKNKPTGQVHNDDGKKLKAFTLSCGKFRYEWGAYLNWFPSGSNEPYEIVWFKDGKQVANPASTGHEPKTAPQKLYCIAEIKTHGETGRSPSLFEILRQFDVCAT